MNESSHDVSKVRLEYVAWLKLCLLELECDTNQATSIAYAIVGRFMNQYYIPDISSDAPIYNILTVAGELETNPDNAEELRLELIELIQQL